jgi:uncharacterized protein with LGFP repeats
VGAAWTATGGEAGPLGYPTTWLICGLRNGGCGQVFQGGRIYDTATTGAHPVSGAIQATWIGQGAEAGPLGYAAGDQVCGLAAGGCKQDFQGGTVYSHPTAGTRWVTGAVATAWAASGGEGGPLGYPTSGLICGLKSSGCGQVFQGGRIYDTTTTGAHAVSGPIHTAWVAHGFEVGPLGYATGDQVCGLAGGGCTQDFQGGTIAWSTGTGAHPVQGSVLSTWRAQSAQDGGLAYPTTDAACGPGPRCEQSFSGGVVSWTTTTPAVLVDTAQAPMFAAWSAKGGQASVGLPVANAVCGLLDSGCRQDFEKGALYSSASTGVNLVAGPILDQWRGQGAAQNGYLGYPTDDALCGLADGGCVQDFQEGVVAWSTATGAWGVNGPVLDAWEEEGAEAGRLGYPTSNGWSSQGDPWKQGFFQHGRIDARADDGGGPVMYQVTLY